MARLKEKIEYEHLDGPTITVRATRTGEYEYSRRRGDDILGPGNGDVFTLYPRMITEYDTRMGKPILDENGKPKMRLLTAEEQFSVHWMERIDEGTEERVTGPNEAIVHSTEHLKPSGRKARGQKG